MLKEEDEEDAEESAAFPAPLFSEYISSDEETNTFFCFLIFKV